MNDIHFIAKPAEHPEPYQVAYSLAQAWPELAKEIHIAAQRDLGLAETLVEFIADIPRDILLIEALSRWPEETPDSLSSLTIWQLATKLAA